MGKIRVFLDMLRCQASAVPDPRVGRRNLQTEFSASVVGSAESGDLRAIDDKRVTLVWVPDEEVVECYRGEQMTLVIPLSNVAYMIPSADQAAAETAGEGAQGGKPLPDMAAVLAWRKAKEEADFNATMQAERARRDAEAAAQMQAVADAQAAEQATARKAGEKSLGQKLTEEKAQRAEAERKAAGEPPPDAVPAPPLPPAESVLETLKKPKK